jgi:hypothetical protein
MLCPPAVNDNGSDSCRPMRPSALARPARVPDGLEAEIGRLQARADRVRLDALAFILAMAAREAGRVAKWERRVRSELDTLQGRHLTRYGLSTWPMRRFPG